MPQIKSLSKGEWTQEQDDSILRLDKEGKLDDWVARQNKLIHDDKYSLEPLNAKNLGTTKKKWSDIAIALKGRNNNTIKNVLFCLQKN
jgi:hypothetical protein